MGNGVLEGIAPIQTDEAGYCFVKILGEGWPILPVEEVIIRDRQTQNSSTGGITVTWGKGATVTVKLQISNMENVLIAQAQGVKPTGYLVVKNELADMFTIDTYLEFPRGGYFLRVADRGVTEAGAGAFKERQFTVEAMGALPK